MNLKYNNVLTKEFLAENYIDRQLSANTIAANIGCSVPMIGKYLRKFGIPMRMSNKGKKYPQLKVLTKEFLIEQYVNNVLSTNDIGELVNCTGASVLKYLRMFGIPAREETTEKDRAKRSGTKHWNWQGGITPLYKMIRELPEYGNWRSLCLIRDSNRCRECFTCPDKNIDLEVHHCIAPFSVLLKEFLQEYNQFSPIEEKEILTRLATKWLPFWRLDNGKTLCESCHDKETKETHRLISLSEKSVNEPI